MVKIGAALLALPAVAARQHWVVIVTGSNTYSNYRHHADACHHAYQIAKAKGVPDDHIILMAYDDIANHRSNLFPGQLFNKPDPTGPGYKGADVTPANFRAVFESTSRGKKLESTSEDNVFVFFFGPRRSRFDRLPRQPTTAPSTVSLSSRKHLAMTSRSLLKSLSWTCLGLWTVTFNLMVSAVILVEFVHGAPLVLC